jgi:outer membrane immunogenic protein
MKHAIAFGLSLLGLGAAPALAADLPVKAPRPAPIAMAPVYNWTGCYIGGHVGGGWFRDDQTRVGIVPLPGAAPGAPLNNDFGSGRGSSFIGGGQAGCDYQFANTWVVGIQGMGSFGRLRETHVNPSFPTFFSETTIKHLITATGRVGYLVVPEVLLYVKGGAAWTRAEHVSTGTVPIVFLSESATSDRFGWTVGGGLEWMFAQGWSVFAEYNYLDFGTERVTFTRGPLAVAGFETIADIRVRAHTAMVGLNYKFNFGGPIVARY